MKSRAPLLFVAAVVCLVLVMVGGTSRDGGERLRPGEAGGPAARGVVTLDAAPPIPDAAATMDAPRIGVGGGPGELERADEPTLVLRFVSEVTGAPLAGVEFEVASERRSNRAFVEGVSDADGLARLTELPADVLLVRSKACPGHAAKVSGLWYEREGVELHEVRLEAGRSVLVRVLDDLDEPLAGASVFRSSLDVRDSFANGLLGTTDAAGELLVEHLAPLAQQVWIEEGRAAPRAWRQPYLWVTEPGGDRWSPRVGGAVGSGEEWPEVFVVRFPRSTRVRAEVVDVDGSPVEGVRVSAFGRYRSPGAVPGPGEAWTDASGRCELDVRAGGERASIKAQFPDGRRMQRPMEVAPGRTVDVRFVPEVSAGLVLEPVDATTGERIAHPGWFGPKSYGGPNFGPFSHSRERPRGSYEIARVSIQDWSGWSWPRWQALEDGRILVSPKRELEAGSLLFLELKDHLRASASIPADSREPLRVACTPLERWRVTLTLLDAEPLLAGLEVLVGLCERETWVRGWDCECRAGVDLRTRIPRGVASVVGRVPADSRLYVHLEVREQVEGLVRVTEVPFGPFVPSRGEVDVRVSWNDLVPPADEKTSDGAKRPRLGSPPLVPEPSPDLREGPFLVRVIPAGAEEVSFVEGPRGVGVLPRRAGSVDEAAGVWFASSAPSPCPLRVITTGGDVRWVEVERWEPDVPTDVRLAEGRPVELLLEGFTTEEQGFGTKLEVVRSGERFAWSWIDRTDRRTELLGTRSFALGLAPGAYRARWRDARGEGREEEFEVAPGSGPATFRFQR